MINEINHILEHVLVDILGLIDAKISHAKLRR
jgi:hypothetical protein